MGSSHSCPFSLNTSQFSFNMQHKILQWNCNGLKFHYADIKQLIIENNPFCICLQETHLRQEEVFNLKGFHCFHKEVPSETRAKGGVAIFLKENIPSDEINIISDLQATAISILYPLKVTLCNLYLPDFRWSKTDLENLISQLPRPFILIGDFNAHNESWGSTNTDRRGKIIEEILEDHGLITLNTGTGTYLNSRSRTFSAIDLTITTPLLGTRLSWNVLEENLYSDHHPIVIEYLGISQTEVRCTRWNLDKADWTSFQEEVTFSELNALNVDESVNFMTNKIVSAAIKHIPKIKNFTKKHVPWWNGEVESAIKDKKRALNKFKRYPTIENMIDFKRKRAKARQVINIAKRQTWHSYVDSLNSESSMIDVWKKIHKISGRNHAPASCAILEDDKIHSDDKSIAEVLGRHFQSVSSSDNYTLQFSITKDETEKYLDFGECDLAEYNENLRMEELEHALQHCKRSASGPDDIPYEFIKHLRESEKQGLLNVFNNIWRESQYPDAWREALVIPIPKPGKDPKYVGNYRPISLTCCLSKIMEKMINSRLVWYMEKNGFLNPFQMVF